MPKRVKIGEEEAEVLVKEDLDHITESINKGFGRLSGELERIKAGAGGASAPQVYPCPDCDYSTQNLGSFVKHVAREQVVGASTPLPREPEEKRGGHRTLRETVACPECRKNVLDLLSERADFPETLANLGYVRKEEPKKAEKGGLEL